MFEGASLESVKALLSEPKKIVLLAHKNPDGDTLGAVMAMYHYLKAKGHAVTAIVPNAYPDFYSWMPGINHLLVYDTASKQAQISLAEATLIFCLDFNATNRVGVMANLLKQAKGIKILVDHHLEPTDEFNHYFTTTDTSSTGEIIYELITALGDGRSISKEVAVCLYTCIVTDTGSFSYACNRSRTYEVTADLVARGVDSNLVHRLVYDTFSEHRLRLLGFALSERMLVWKKFHSAVIWLTQNDLKKFNFQVGDTEGLVNYPLSISNINLAILITEKGDVLRLSFRSKGDFSVNQLAREYFEGGGHKNAAGGNSSLNMDKTLEKLKIVLSQHKEQLDYELKYQ